MRGKILARLIVTAALLILALPIATSAQFYDYNYDRTDRREVHDAIRQLESSSSRLESDLNYARPRRVLGGLFWMSSVDNRAITEVRDFRQAVRDLRMTSRDGFALSRSIDEAQIVLDRGVQVDRYLRLRTGKASVDADLADIRSSLHIIADAYGLRMPY